MPLVLVELHSGQRQVAALRPLLANECIVIHQRFQAHDDDSLSRPTVPGECQVVAMRLLSLHANTCRAVIGCLRPKLRHRKACLCNLRALHEAR